jgi:hypothetical protein
MHITANFKTAAMRAAGMHMPAHVYLVEPVDNTTDPVIVTIHRVEWYSCKVDDES